jgi:cytochrome c oxidase assembly factor CtaG
VSAFLVSLSLLLSGVMYARGWARLRHRLPHRFGWPQLLCFMAGLDLIFVALVSPLDAWAGRSLLGHMAQHLILMIVAPPLIWLGAPLAPLLRGLPRPLAQILTVSVITWPPLRRLSGALTHPAVGWGAFVVATWAWHVPAMYELALRSDAWHHVEHVCFLLTALLFWWPVVQPWPSRSRWPRWAMVPYLLLAEVQGTVLAAFFTFAGRPLYRTYADIEGGVRALQDQVAAGVLMWGLGSLAFLVPAGCLVMRLLAPSEATSEDPPVRAGSALSWP